MTKKQFQARVFKTFKQDLMDHLSVNDKCFAEKSVKDIEVDIKAAIKFLEENDKSYELARKTWESLTDEQKQFLSVKYGHRFNFAQFQEVLGLDFPISS